jgi:hypothetical protein
MCTTSWVAPASIVRPLNLVRTIMDRWLMAENLNTPDEQQACDCSSTIIGEDKSNYWAPYVHLFSAFAR